MKNIKTFVVIPNWNGKDKIGKAIDSLLAQHQAAEIVVVENGSIDGSVEYLKQNYRSVTLLEQTKNLGFAGGVNVGIRYAIENNAELVALFNNDAVSDKDWLSELEDVLEANIEVGIATCRFLDETGTHFDSTGEGYSVWGLPYPRGRGELVSDEYDGQVDIFAASGGASLYRVKMLEQIGLFDEAFFAYYEDIDLSFRAQLTGWKVKYVPTAIAYHQIGATSSKIKGFTTYQTIKNLPMLVRKNVPLRLLPKVLPRFFVAHSAFFWSAVARGHGLPALRGWLYALTRLPKNLLQRRDIQKNMVVSVDYIWNMMTHDLPPDASRLRKFRNRWWQLIGRRT